MVNHWRLLVMATRLKTRIEYNGHSTAFKRDGEADAKLNSLGIGSGSNRVELMG